MLNVLKQIPKAFTETDRFILRIIQSEGCIKFNLRVSGLQWKEYPCKSDVEKSYMSKEPNKKKKLHKYETRNHLMLVFQENEFSFLLSIQKIFTLLCPLTFRRTHIYNGGRWEKGQTYCRAAPTREAVTQPDPKGIVKKKTPNRYKLRVWQFSSQVHNNVLRRWTAGLRCLSVLILVAQR